jgi:hypothetical protein
MADSYEFGNESSVSIKGMEFLKHLRDYCPLKMDPVQWSKFVSSLVLG